MSNVPFIPETALFTDKQCRWLNDFLAGMFTSTTLPSERPDSREPLVLLYGSQTGTTDGLAKRAAQEALKHGFDPNDEERKSASMSSTAGTLLSGRSRIVARWRDPVANMAVLPWRPFFRSRPFSATRRYGRHFRYPLLSLAACLSGKNSSPPVQLRECPDYEILPRRSRTDIQTV